MGKYKAYEQYKDSGVEWLGEIPEHWEVWKFNHFAPIITCGVAATPEYGDDGIIFLSAQNIKKGSIDLDIGYKYISKEKHKELTKYRKPTKGDILLSRVGTVGEACVVDVDYEFSIFVSITHIRVLKSICDNNFLVFYFSSSLAKSLYKATTLIGGGVGNLNVNDLREYKIPLPPLEEQNTIAQFLDHKTSQIDALISKKEALLEKLDEKRTALISHAVTKGLDPTVPMKDSGIEWLGDIPAHWQAVRLKHITDKIIDGAHFTPTYVGNGVPFLRVTDIVQAENKSINMNNIKFIPEEEHQALSTRCKPEKGDLLYSKNGTIGVSRVIDWDFEFSIFVSLCLIKIIKHKINVTFLQYSLLGKLTETQINIGAKSNTVTNLHLDKIKEFWVALPPLDEQAKIIQHLDQKTAEIDQQKAKIKQAIDLLKEYRTALITNAVTGKIDVRQVPIPQP